MPPAVGLPRGWRSCGRPPPCIRQEGLLPDWLADGSGLHGAGFAVLSGDGLGKLSPV